MRIPIPALAAAVLASFTPASAQDAPAVPAVTFDLPTPEGWRTETIAFPPDFAPALAYDGLEELRFAPGMFDVKAEDFWSYAFVWWLPENTAVDAEQLSNDLRAYFRGLMHATAHSRGFRPQDDVFRCDLQAPEGAEGWRGTVTAFDAFVTGEPIELNTRIVVEGCPEQGRQAVVFEFSPQPETHDVWKALDGIRDGFRCTPEAPGTPSG